MVELTLVSGGILYVTSKVVCMRIMHVEDEHGDNECLATAVWIDGVPGSPFLVKDTPEEILPRIGL